MGKVRQPKAAGHGEGEEGQRAVETASERVDRGDMEGALWLLQRAQRLHPSVPGLAEIEAVARVCLAAAWNPCSCSSKRASQHSFPHWYRILMVDEKADASAIKKRYRQLALLLHPDKNKHARAEDAFKLLSEAYSHLSDSKKRNAFDSYLRERECRTCCTESLPAWSKANYRESLKERSNDVDYWGCSLSADFHISEWRMEHQKLRLFREQAQAKVESLARTLKEQRSRWNEKMSVKTGRYNSSGCKINGHSEFCFRNNVDTESGKEFRSWNEGFTGKKSWIGYEKTSQRVDAVSDASIVEKRLVQGRGHYRTSSGTQTQVLQECKGFPGMLKGQMSQDNREDTKSKNGRNCSKPNEGATIPVHACRAGCMSTTGGPSEERPQQRQNFKRCQATAFKEKPKRNIDEASASNTEVTGTCNTIYSKKSISELDKRKSNLSYRHDVVMLGNCATSHSSLQSNGDHLWRESGNAEELMIKKQKKKSDQLLRTLEQLHEEMQTVVATLESMKTEARIFPAPASCRIPAAIAT